MKARIIVGLCVTLIASCFSVLADDTPAQAAARAALEQKMYDLDHPEAQPSPNTNSVTAVAKPVGSATNITNTVTTNAVILQTAPVTTTPAAAPTTEASAADTPVTETPTVEAPAATTPVAGPAAKPSLGLHAATLPGSSEQARPANELMTNSGSVYKNVEVERVMADGIIISYTPANGGWAMTKVYFQDLPNGLRQQYQK